MKALRDDAYRCSTLTSQRKSLKKLSEQRRTAQRLLGGRTLALLGGLIAAAASGEAHAAIVSVVTAGGYTFTNFSPDVPGSAGGSNVNGISNTGQVAGATLGSPATNFTGTAASQTVLNTGAGQTAFGVNSAGDVVGGNGTTAFFLPKGGSPQTLATPGNAINAFGINDGGNIVGQFLASSGQTLGFYLPSAGSTTFTAVLGPGNSGVVNAQGINNDGLIVGFYVGADGQDHGFEGNTANIAGQVLQGIPVADPTIPSLPTEPGATFVFSQILGVNDHGIAVGYYGDSTTSQHGFFYNTNTGAYTFLDDPAAGFDNGVEVTQITGISNTGEIAGFYTTANGLAYSFTAVPTSVPEPSTWILALAGFAGVGYCAARVRPKPGSKQVEAAS